MAGDESSRSQCPTCSSSVAFELQLGVRNKFKVSHVAAGFECKFNPHGCHAPGHTNWLEREWLMRWKLRRPVVIISGAIVQVIRNGCWSDWNGRRWCEIDFPVSTHRCRQLINVRKKSKTRRHDEIDSSRKIYRDSHYHPYWSASQLN